MPAKKQTPLKEGEAKKGHQTKVKNVPRTVNIREELFEPFLRVCHKEYTDLTKRINFLISEDLKKHGEHPEQQTGGTA